MIEPAHPRDAEAVAAVLHASIRELCAPDHAGNEETIARWSANKTPEQAARWIDNPALLVLVARAGKEVAAVGMCSGEEVLLNYVGPAHRFRGHSKGLLVAMEAHMASVGTREGRLSTTLTAHRFYRDHGWQDAGPLETMFGLSGQPMVKRLG